MWKQGLAIVALFAIASCAEIRSKRQFFAPGQECAISHDEIEELVQLTRLIEGRRGSRKRPSSASGPVTDEANDECSRQLRGLKNSIQEVVSRYGTMQKSSVSQSAYERMKAEQETELADLFRRVDNLEREVERRFLDEIERLRNSLQELRRRLNDNLRLLEREREAGRRAQEALCVSYIQGERLDAAVRIFRNLNGSYDAVRLINDTYQADADMVAPLVEFFKALREDAQAFGTIGGLEELVRQVEHNNQLNRERCRTIFHSLVGLESYYTEPGDISRVLALRVKLIEKLNSFIG